MNKLFVHQNGGCAAMRLILVIAALLLASCGSGVLSVSPTDGTAQSTECAASYIVMNDLGDYKCSQFGAKAADNIPGRGIFQTFNLIGTSADGTTVNIQTHKSMGSNGYFTGIFDKTENSIQNYNSITKAGHDWTAARVVRTARVMGFKGSNNRECFGFIAPGSPGRGGGGWEDYQQGFFCLPLGRPALDDPTITALLNQIVLRTSVSTAFQPTATAPSPQSLQAGAILFAPPSVGTRFATVSGGYFQVMAIDGMNITTVNAANRTAKWLGGFLYIPNQVDRTMIETIWPLEPGKSVTFEEHASNSDAWRHSVTVVRRETLQTPAGTFDTFVIEERIQSLSPAQGNLDATKTYWYAPAAKWAVKRSMVQRSGPPLDSAPYLVSAITVP
jgi:hypothetical protein